MAFRSRYSISFASWPGVSATCFLMATLGGCGGGDGPSASSATSTGASVGGASATTSSSGATTGGMTGAGGATSSSSGIAGAGGTGGVASSAGGATMGSGGMTSSSVTGGGGAAASSAAGSGGMGGSGGTSTATGGMRCLPGASQACYTGPQNTLGVGQCHAGMQTCDADGAGYGPCVGEILPEPETCATPLDDDCNGLTNEGGVGCLCVPASTASCYSGPAGTDGVGPCHAGTQQCNGLGTGYGPCTGEVTPQAETCSTPVDDDCNGQVNEGGEGCVCAPGSAALCYTGPPSTVGVGACQAGTHLCDAQGTSYGPCVGEIVPQPETCATPVDDDCNGQVNEGGDGCVCVPNATTACYSGPVGTVGVGICASGTHTCNADGTAYSACSGEVLPQAESCATVTDDDCNGQVNEGCVCVPGATASCYSGPASTAGVGICVAGTKTCNSTGTAYSACVGEVLPQSESCATPADDDCNGQINEGCACAPNTTAGCYSGPAATDGVGICHAGTQTCNAAGTAYGPCSGEVVPQGESCLTAVDDNCDGQINEGCICAPSSTSSCYSGPSGTAGVGACLAGTQTCNAQGTAYGPCVGEVLPQPETCATAVDDDCNGQVNEGGAGCVCLPNSTLSCYSGPVGTAGVGACLAGTKACNAQGTAYSACSGEVLPQAESCLTAVDDNCNGQANEGCVCVPGATASCYGGPAGTAGVGLCVAGTKTCNATGTAYGACSGDVLPQGESCATVGDDNCNGQANEGCVCVPGTTQSCYSGPAGTAGVGICQAGTQTCNAPGTAYSACSGEVLPQALESCATPGDDDCNGALCDGSSLLGNEWGSTTDDEGFAVTTDASGNIFLGGYISGTVDFGCGPLSAPSSADAAFLLKLGKAGNCLWNKAMGGTAHINGVVTDAAGNVYATGFFFNTIDFGGGILTAGAEDIFAVKYSPTGVHQWSKRYGDAAIQESVGIGIDAAANLYLTGYFYSKLDFGGGQIASAGTMDVYLAKLTSAGTSVWTKGFGDANPQRPYGIAVDPSGNVALTGGYQGTINFGGATLTSAGLNDAFVARFTAAGAHVWSKGAGDASDQVGTGVGMDSAGNTFATGYFSGTINLGGTAASLLTSQGGSDVYLARFDSSGNHVWSEDLGGAGNQTSVALTVDWSGSVAVAGTLMGSADFGGGVLMSVGAGDVFVAKYTSLGGFLWSKQFGDAATQTTRGMWVDPSGNLFVTGVSTSAVDFGGGLLPHAGGEDAILVKLGP